MQADKALKALNVLSEHYNKVKVERTGSSSIDLIIEGSYSLPEFYGFGRTLEEAVQNAVEKLEKKIELMRGILDEING